MSLLRKKGIGSFWSLVLLATAGSMSTAALAVVPINGAAPTLTPVTINNGPGDQFDPHVSGDWVAYTSDIAIRYYNFATNTDAQIPLGASAHDLLSDVSGSKIVFSRVIYGDRTAVMVFDAATPAIAPVEIDAASGTRRWDAAIGGNTVAYIDFGLHPNGELVIHDLTTSISTRITNDTALDQNPAVAPDGNVVVWQHCSTTSSTCDLWQAVKTGVAWSVSVASVASSYIGFDRNIDTNGTLVVHDSFPATDSDLFWRPVSGGAEVQMQIAGWQFIPRIAGNYIAFASRVTLFDTSDIFVYDIVGNRLYQITDTPLVTEDLNDITVLPNGDLRVVWESDEDGFELRNIKGATFHLPNVDTTPPVLTVPATLTVNATSPSGAAVSYAVTATDAVDPNPTVSCAPASGSTFPVGTTAVACTATDAFGNSATAGFNVIVNGAPDQITALIALVQSFNIKQGIENSLDAKLQNVFDALNAASAGNMATACSKLGAFINEVLAQSGKALTTAQANQLIAAANQVKASLGCP